MNTNPRQDDEARLTNEIEELRATLARLRSEDPELADDIHRVGRELAELAEKLRSRRGSTGDDA